MASTTVGQLLSNRSLDEPPEITNLKSTLTKQNFMVKIANWAQLTEAGPAFYEVGTVSDEMSPSAAKVTVIVVVYCDKTPVTRFVPNWKFTDALNWEYQVSETEKLKVLVKSNDRIMLETLVGSCIQAQTFQRESTTSTKEKQSDALLTLGLIIRLRENKDKIIQDASSRWALEDPGETSPDQMSRWAVLTAHSFNHEKISGNTHPPNKLLACPPQGVGRECKTCLSQSCKDCGSIKDKVVLASGENQVFRTKRNDPQSVRLRLLDPLDVTGIKEVLKQAKPEQYEQGTLDSARKAFEKLKYAGSYVPRQKLMELHLNKNKTGPIYLFKKGAMSGWTWGLLEQADEIEFMVRSTALDIKANPLSDHGDCGAIWFVLEPTTNRAHSVGCHYGRSSRDTTVAAESRLALGFLYETAFDPKKAIGILSMMTNWKPENLKIDFAESYGPFADGN